MVSASLIDSVSQAKGIPIYFCVTNVGYHLACTKS